MKLRNCAVRVSGSRRSHCQTMAFTLVLALGACRGATFADTPHPKLVAIFPAGVQAGKSIDVELTGDRLAMVSQLEFSAAGLKATKLGNAKFRVSAAADCRPQTVDVFAVSSEGTSNPRGFVVGAAPIVLDKEPNDLREQAQAVGVDTAIHGRMDARADVDYFKLEIPKNRRVLVHVMAIALDAKMVPAVTVFDDEGRPIDRTRDYSDIDTPIVLGPFPTKKTVAVRVHDLVFAGGAEYWYRLELSSTPFVWMVWPPAIGPLATAPPQTLTAKTPAPQLSAIGWNLPGGAPIHGEPAHGISKVLWELLASRGCSLAPLHLDDARVLPLPGSAFVPPVMAIGDNVVLQPKDRRLRESLIGLAEFPIQLEAEPNDVPDRAQAVKLPCEILGFFDSRSDRDWYRISLRKGQRVRVVGICERAGFSGDMAIQVRRVRGAAGAKPLQLEQKADYDDNSTNPAGVQFAVASVDPEATFTADADADFVIEVADRYGLHSARSIYRLRLGEPVPFAKVILLPQPESVASGIAVNPGGRTALRAYAFRSGQADMAVDTGRYTSSTTRTELAALHFASGVSEMPAVLIGPLQSAGRVGMLQAVSGDRVVAGAVPANFGTVLWPAADKVNRPARLMRANVVGLATPPAGYRLNIPTSLVAAPGSRHRIPLTLERIVKDYTGPLDKINLFLPPAIVEASPTAIGDKQTTGAIDVHIKSNASPGEYRLVAVGVGQVPWPQNPDDPKSPRSAVPISDPSNPLLVRVVPAPVAIKLANAVMDAKIGGTAIINVKLTRKQVPPRAVRIELTLPPGVIDVDAKAVEIPADKSEGNLAVRIGAKAAVGEKGGLTVRASAESAGAVVFVDEIITLKIAK